MIERNSETWRAAISGWDIGRDPELAAILEGARDHAVDRMLDILGDSVPPVPPDDLRAVGRSMLGLMEAATREWLDRGRLSREQVLVLLNRAFVALLYDIAPDVARGASAVPVADPALHHADELTGRRA